MIGQRIFETIATIAGVVIGLTAFLLGSYLVYSVTPQWLRTFALGLFLFWAGGTTLAVIGKAMSNKAVDEQGKPRQS